MPNTPSLSSGLVVLVSVLSITPSTKNCHGRYSSRATAKLLNVDRSTIALWCKSRKLDAVQDAPLSAYRIRLTPEIIARLRKPTP